jgi:hypothetical protein
MTIRIPRAIVVFALIATTLATAAVAAFAVGRTIGRSSVHRQAIRSHAYAAGYRQGYAAGAARGWARGAALGRAAGTRRGFASGYVRGYRAAIKRSSGAIYSAFRAGVNDAFAGYGGWDVGHYYIVAIAVGSGGSRYQIPSRIEMIPGHDYALCADRDGVCGQLNLPASATRPVRVFARLPDPHR